MTTTDDLNDKIQQSPNRTACMIILYSCTARELRIIADLNHLDTFGAPSTLRHRILNDVFPL